jgi:DNA-binding protein YbaB
MFDNLKQLGKLKELKDVLEKERQEAEKDGVRVVVNGKMEVEEIELNPQLANDKQAKAVKDAVNQALNQVRQSAARKMMSL